VDLANPGSYIAVHNAKVDMQKGNMRLLVAQGTGTLQAVHGVKFEPKVRLPSCVEFMLHRA
jgi:hypothetical protein